MAINEETGRKRKDDNIQVDKVFADRQALSQNAICIFPPYLTSYTYIVGESLGVSAVFAEGRPQKKKCSSLHYDYLPFRCTRRLVCSLLLNELKIPPISSSFQVEIMLFVSIYTQQSGLKTVTVGRSGTTWR